MAFLPCVAILLLHIPELVKWAFGGISKGEKRRNCIQCGREIPWDANICPYCGHKF
ncbi:MAG: zinc ribbon domain-containing protein [Promethearchaeota archaeon]